MNPRRQRKAPRQPKLDLLERQRQEAEELEAIRNDPDLAPDPDAAAGHSAAPPAAYDYLEDAIRGSEAPTKAAAFALRRLGSELEPELVALARADAAARNLTLAQWLNAAMAAVLEACPPAADSREQPTEGN